MKGPSERQPGYVICRRRRRGVRICQFSIRDAAAATDVKYREWGVGPQAPDPICRVFTVCHDVTIALRPTAKRIILCIRSLKAVCVVTAGLGASVHVLDARSCEGRPMPDIAVAASQLRGPDS